jgi:hypothetical protein
LLDDRIVCRRAAFRLQLFPIQCPSRLGVGFSGELPEFVVQVPDTRSEVSGETVARLGLSWVRDWLADTPHQSDAPLVRSPILPQWKTASDIWFAARLGFTPVGTAAGLVHGGLTGESAAKIDQAVLPSPTRWRSCKSRIASNRCCWRC